jgi:hypothetical protein
MSCSYGGESATYSVTSNTDAGAPAAAAPGAAATTVDCRLIKFVFFFSPKRSTAAR